MFQYLREVDEVVAAREDRVANDDRHAVSSGVLHAGGVELRSLNIAAKRLRHPTPVSPPHAVIKENKLALVHLKVAHSLENLRDYMLIILNAPPPFVQLEHFRS